MGILHVRGGCSHSTAFLTTSVLSSVFVGRTCLHDRDQAHSLRPVTPEHRPTWGTQWNIRVRRELLNTQIPGPYPRTLRGAWRAAFYCTWVGGKGVGWEGWCLAELD